MKEEMLVDNLAVSKDGHLLFAGMDTTDLARQYGTPLYLYDEERIRYNCRTYVNALKKAFGDNAKALYASKAASFQRMYKIIHEEGMGTDVVSIGEIITAQKAGFPLENAFFHSNNKTDEDIRFAIGQGVGYFVVDNPEELLAIEQEAALQNKTQKILIRITPGIDPHTYEAISTGKVDSKFGNAIETGAADEITRLALLQNHVKLCGFHCHVGSQVFDSEVYKMASHVMLGFIAHVEKDFGCKVDMLDIGGGYGVRYTSNQPKINIAECIEELADFIKNECNVLNITEPHILMEPGRSICADASITLYTVGSVKNIPGYKNYVSVDGSMCDNIRYALYKAPYTVLPADKMNEQRTLLADVVGRCCESGDIIQNMVLLPETLKRGNLLAVLTTGAYHYAMASNYNMLAKPPIIMIHNKESYVAVKRQSYFQVCENDT